MQKKEPAGPGEKYFWFVCNRHPFYGGFSTSISGVELFFSRRLHGSAGNGGGIMSLLDKTIQSFDPHDFICVSEDRGSRSASPVVRVVRVFRPRRYPPGNFVTPHSPNYPATKCS